MKLKNSLKSFALVMGLGIAAGLITTCLDLLPYDTLWSFSSIASAFGFWIITITLVIYFSSSNINASINVFLYLSSMNFIFYFSKYVLGFFIPRFYRIEGFNWALLKRFDLIALACALVSFVLYYWNKDNKISNVLYALPICGLGAETIGVGMYLFQTHTYLFQLLLNILGLILLIRLFRTKLSNRLIFTMTAILGSFVGFGLFYLPSLT